uniref:Venom S1 protease 4 n=1 Tax=Platymeris rhadamanthus TaxID=1134088 RepID=A0A6B9L539_PLARH|nr:venom S1 protease 4 [Platymeris rhadamanthus]
MIRYIALLAFVFAVANGKKYFHDIKIKTGEELKLRPQIEDGPAESKWTLEACEGCKVVLSCVILSRTCDDHLLTVHDGKSYHYYCGPEMRYILKTSIYNKMKVSIETQRLRSGSYCRATATKPYTNLKYEKIDSSEHGNGKGATRQTSCKCGWANKSPSRIVGGDETAINEYPFAVQIMLSRRKFAYCGGSIITPYHVLTAAHCTYPFYGIKLSVVVGEHDVTTDKETPHTKIIEVERVMDHPKYNDKSNEFDIAVIKLKEKIVFNDAVGPVCLPNYRNKNLHDEYVKVMGWGHLRTNGSSSPVLRKVNLKVIDLEVCKAIYNSIDLTNPFQICTWAPSKDSCQGDSGGPLVWREPTSNRYVQAALVSYGRDCASTDPGVNSDISYFMDWIREKIRETAPEEVCI